jgi:hypothetical protein
MPVTSHKIIISTTFNVITAVWPCKKNEQNRILKMTLERDLQDNPAHDGSARYWKTAGGKDGLQGRRREWSLFIHSHGK